MAFTLMSIHVKPLRPDFNLERLVTFIAALWLQATLLVILCGISSPHMPRPSANVDALRTMAVNAAQTGDAHPVAM